MQSPILETLNPNKTIKHLPSVLLYKLRPPKITDAYCQGNDINDPFPFLPSPLSCDWLEQCCCVALSVSFFVSLFIESGLCTNTGFFFQRAQNGLLKDAEEIFAEFDQNLCWIRIADCTFNVKIP